MTMFIAYGITSLISIPHFFCKALDAKLLFHPSIHRFKGKYTLSEEG